MSDPNAGIPSSLDAATRFASILDIAEEGIIAVDRDRRARPGWRTIRAGWTRLWINHRTCPGRTPGHQRSPPGPVSTM